MAMRKGRRTQAAFQARLGRATTRLIRPRSFFYLNLKPSQHNHATNTYNVGYDNALMDAANWLSVNDPTSPHNIAS